MGFLAHTAHSCRFHTRMRTVLLPWAFAAWATGAVGGVPGIVTNRATDLFTMRKSLACHTSTCTPRRLVWTAAKADRLDLSAVRRFDAEATRVLDEISRR